jgi:hypothetical protein
MAGTQAAPGHPNSLEVMKLSHLTQAEHGKEVRAECRKDMGGLSSAFDANARDARTYW